MKAPGIMARALILEQLAISPQTAPQLAESTGVPIKSVRRVLRIIKDEITVIGKLPASRIGGQRAGVYALPGTPELVLPTYDLPKEGPRKRTHSGSGVIAGRRLIRGVIYPGGRSHRGGGL